LQLDGGEVGVRELARRLGRHVKRVHEDAAALVDLGLVERTPEGALHCPYRDIHVDMQLEVAA
jgi:predicted transcriptional regulator